MNSRLRVFLEEPGFLKLFRLFRDKYRSLGRIGGVVSVKGFEETEIQAIAGFLGLPSGTLIEKGRVGLGQFENELVKTGYAEFTLLQLLEEVFQEPLLSKKEEAEKILKLENEFLDLLKLEIPEAVWWIDWIRAKSPDTRWIWALYRQDAQLLANMIKKVFDAFMALPINGGFERLPFFAQRTTGNPHYFDISETGGRLLLHCLTVNKKTIEEPEFLFQKSNEEINDLLADYGLLRDDLWNFVTVQGLLASDRRRIHPVWQAAVETNTVMNIPMKELSKINGVWPVTGKQVWIVENSSVASTIMDSVPHASVICTHGQLRAAGWRLLDMLAEDEVKFYYSGDIDPEGVVIADRLRRRYQDKLVFWRMDQAAYEASLSNEEFTERISKLDSVSSQELENLVQMMKERKVAGYQEALVEELIRDIQYTTNLNRNKR